MSRWGRVLYLTERFDEALDTLQAALDVWPDSAQLHLWVGVVLGYVDRHEEAEVHLRAATELVGRFPPFDAAWGGGLARLGRTPEARAVLEEPGDGSPVSAVPGDVTQRRTTSFRANFRSRPMPSAEPAAGQLSGLTHPAIDRARRARLAWGEEEEEEAWPRASMTFPVA
jgi:tetratricopeptide (TPR) repeat protein